MVSDLEIRLWEYIKSTKPQPIPYHQSNFYKEKK